VGEPGEVAEHRHHPRILRSELALDDRQRAAMQRLGLVRAIEVAVRSPEFAAFAQRAKTVPDFRNPEQFAAVIEPERRLFAGLIPRLNIRVQ